MKKNSKRLQLSRETLHRLEKNGTQVAGGSATCDYDDPGGTTGTVWTGPLITCQSCPCTGYTCPCV